MRTTNPDVPKTKHAQLKGLKSIKGLGNVEDAYLLVLNISLPIIEDHLEDLEKLSEELDTSKSELSKKVFKKGLEEVKN